MKIGLFLLLFLLAACTKFSSDVGLSNILTVDTTCVGTTPSTTFVYRVGSTSDNIYRAVLDTTTGCLIEQTPTALTSGDAPTSIAVTPDHKFLFVAKNGANKVDTYTLDQTTGEPTFASSMPTSTAPLKLLMSPTGLAMFGLEYNFIVSYTINATSGALTWHGTTSITGGNSLAIDSTGAHLYSSGTTAGTRSYDIDATTALLSNASTTSGTIANEMRLSPNGNYLYQANYMTANIILYDITAGTGAITFNNYLTLPETTFMYYDLVFNSAGTKMYMLNNYQHFIESFTVNPSTGAMTLLNRVTLVSGCLPNSMAISDDDAFVFTGCTNASGLTYIYQVQVDGSLASETTSQVSSMNAGKVLAVSF